MALVQYQGSESQYKIQRYFYGFTLGNVTGPLGLYDDPDDYLVNCTLEEEIQDNNNDNLLTNVGL